MKREFSAGGSVYNNQKQVLLSQNSSNHYWGFPKGWIDEWETSKEAVLREGSFPARVQTNIII